MLFLTLVLGALLFPKADTLKCYECAPNLFGICTDNTTECASQNKQCVATRTLMFQGGVMMADIKAKGCGETDHCVEGSVNFGTVRNVLKTTCCTTDLCNIQTPDYRSIPNGKKCFSCEGQDCTRTLKCEGNEDHCIKATVRMGGRITLKGCANKVMCSEQLTSLMKQFDGMESYDCCQGNYCNGASSASPGLLLLLVPLFFSVLF